MNSSFQKQIDNCLELISVLNGVPGVLYDQCIFGGTCGTTACALGWATHYNIGGLQWHMGYMPALKIRERWIEGEEAAEEVFGDESWENVFSAGLFDSYTGAQQRDCAIAGLHRQIQTLEEQKNQK